MAAIGSGNRPLKPTGRPLWEVELAGDELAHPAVLHPGQDPRHSVPEDAVVDEDRVGAEVTGAGEELAAGRDPGHETTDLAPALDLQAVGAVVAALAGREQLVEVGDQLVAGDGAHPYSGSFSRRCTASNSS